MTHLTDLFAAIDTNPALIAWLATFGAVGILAVLWVHDDRRRARGARRVARERFPEPDPDVVYDRELDPMDDQAEYWAKWEREFSDDRGRSS